MAAARKPLITTPKQASRPAPAGNVNEALTFDKHKAEHRNQPAKPADKAGQHIHHQKKLNKQEYLSHNACGTHCASVARGIPRRRVPHAC